MSGEQPVRDRRPDAAPPVPAAPSPDDDGTTPMDGSGPAELTDDES